MAKLGKPIENKEKRKEELQRVVEIIDKPDGSAIARKAKGKRKGL